MDLDNREALRANDPGGLGARMAEFPGQLLEGWRIARATDLPSRYGDATAVAILGMGGSAIGGGLVKAIVTDSCPVPIQDIRDYRLPAAVGPHTLVIASSHSGETEETLSAFEEAISRGARLAAVTTGGRLAEMARKHDIPLLEFTHPGPPRAAIGFSVSLILGLLWRAGLVPNASTEMKGAVALLERAGARLQEESPTAQNRAKQIAQMLQGRIPVIYAAEHLSPVARRWKTQFNEVAKTAAFFEILPEFDHNAIEGTGFPEAAQSDLVLISLVSAFYHERSIRRARLTAEILSSRGLQVEGVDVEGDNRLEEALWSVFLGDYASLYLAALNGVDPHFTPNLDSLKQQMAHSEGAD
ncbi:MAG: bifunctional phosphoglucose/phosphomannose isomerase [Anaerolineae bacterium]